MNEIDELLDQAPSPKVQAIRAFTAAGWTLIPLRGKIPTIKNWTETPKGAYGEKDLAPVGINYGVVLGPDDLVVDVDPRNFSPDDQPLSRLTVLLGGKLESFTVKTGGGGFHIYFKKPHDVVVLQALKEFKGIEFKTAGRQVVGPGSVHPESKLEYKIVRGSPARVEEIPAQLLDLIRKPAAVVDDGKEGTGEYKDDPATQGRFTAYLTDSAKPSIMGEGGDDNAFRVACHGRDLGLSPAATWELMLEIWNPKCAPPWDAFELRVKVFHAYRYARGTVGSAHPQADFTKVPKADSEGRGAAAPLNWDCDKADKPRKTFQNLLNYFHLPASGLSKVFGFNDFTGQVEFMNPAPWHKGRMPINSILSDHDLNQLKAHLAVGHAFEMPVQTLLEAISVIAHENRFHPVREYLESLTWDGTPRLDFWLRDFLGVTETPYTKACARKALCAAVMRVMKPGVKFDHVLVLEGAQGIGKSTVCDILGGKWAADFPVDPHNKDTVQLMQGRWVIELAELEVQRRTDMEALKAFITRRMDKVRLAYGHLVSEFPRQSIFIASKNPNADGTYLKDDENRRWWPVACAPRGGMIDFKGLKDARNQLFAEALHLVRTKGEGLSMETEELRAEAREAVAARHAEDPWMERIAQWIEESAKSRDFLTAREIYVDALYGLDKQFDRKAQLSIARAMRMLGWETCVKRIGERTVRGYARVHQRFLNVDQETAELLGDLI